MNANDIRKMREEAKDEENRGNLEEGLRWMESALAEFGADGGLSGPNYIQKMSRPDLTELVEYHRALLSNDAEFEAYLPKHRPDYDPYAIRLD